MSGNSVPRGKTIQFDGVNERQVKRLIDLFFPFFPFEDIKQAWQTL